VLPVSADIALTGGETNQDQFRAPSRFAPVSGVDLTSENSNVRQFPGMRDAPNWHMDPRRQGRVDLDLNRRPSHDQGHPVMTVIMDLPHSGQGESMFGWDFRILDLTPPDLAPGTGGIHRPGAFNVPLDFDEWNGPHAPVPGALLLSTLGMGLIGWTRRRRAA
jgi:hypothetical protein